MTCASGYVCFLDWVGETVYSGVSLRRKWAVSWHKHFRAVLLLKKKKSQVEGKMNTNFCVLSQGKINKDARG